MPAAKTPPAPAAPAAPTPEPTPADLQAIIANAQAAIERATSAADAAEKVASAAQDTATERGLGEIPPEVIEQITGGIVAAFETRGAFRTDPPPAPAGTGAADDAPPAEPEAPKTFAQRWLGV